MEADFESSFDFAVQNEHVHSSCLFATSEQIELTVLLPVLEVFQSFKDKTFTGLESVETVLLDQETGPDFIIRISYISSVNLTHCYALESLAEII